MIQNEDDQPATNLRHEIRLILLKYPTMPVDVVCDRIEKLLGRRPAKVTVSAVRADFRQVMRLLVDHRLLPASLLEDGLVPNSQNGNADTENRNANRNARRMCKVCKRQLPRPKRSHTVFCSAACKQPDLRLNPKEGI